MTTLPNQFILPQGTETFGLHRFADKKPDRYTTMICQLHPSGEWITLRPPTAEQMAIFQKFGVKPDPNMPLAIAGLARTESKLVLKPSPAAPGNPETIHQSRATGSLSPAQKAWETRRQRRDLTFRNNLSILNSNREKGASL